MLAVTQPIVAREPLLDSVHSRMADTMRGAQRDFETRHDCSLLALAVYNPSPWRVHSMNIRDQQSHLRCLELMDKTRFEYKPRIFAAFREAIDTVAEKVAAVMPHNLRESAELFSRRIVAEKLSFAAKCFGVPVRTPDENLYFSRLAEAFGGLRTTDTPPSATEQLLGAENARRLSYMLWQKGSEDFARQFPLPSQRTALARQS